MVDPDATSRSNPQFRCWLHWIVQNVPGHGHDFTKGDAAAVYQGPAPPKGSGPHRYVFLVYKQTEKFDMTGKVPIPVDEIEARKNFDVTKYLHTHEGKLELVAGNYFLAENK